MGAQPASSSSTSGAVSTGTIVAPTKVCPNCQVQSQTTASKCPNCGKRYKKRKKWPWVILAFLVVFGGCTAIVLASVNNAVNELNKEQASHAITPAQFDSIKIGTPRAQVISTVGKQPEDTQEFTSKGVLSNEQIKSSCIYYNKSGGKFGDIYQFCFDNHNNLESKNSY
jgi:rRNA maturation endonuclease Nob1